MLDIKAVEAQAAKEIAHELATAATAKIKVSLKTIANAERALQNLRAEHAVLLRDISV